MKRAIICVLASMILLIILVGCAAKSTAESSSPSEEALFAIVWPEELLTFCGYTAEEYAADFEDNRDKNLAESWHVNEDHSLTVTMTEDQYDNSREHFGEFVESIKQAWADGSSMEAECSEDFSELSFYIDPEADMMDTITGIKLIIAGTCIQRLYETKGSDDSKVHVSFYNRDNGKLLVDGHVPGEQIDITTEMWDSKE